WPVVTIPAGTMRLTYLATHPSRRLLPYGFIFPSAAERACLPRGLSMMKTSRADGGAWTDVDTELLHCGLWLQ
ncbi:MAG TPA: hypothetical protein VM013_09590, partial [Dehalococcoidia bacterium]|nr:hypothetical protein [Dehalococcoidia bacterium]